MRRLEHLLRSLLSVCLLMLSCYGGAAHADQPSWITIDADQNAMRAPISLSTALEVYEDTTRTLQLSDLSHTPYAQAFHANPASGEALALGYSKSVWWLRLEVRNASPVALARMLEIAYPGLAELDFYQIDAPEGPRAYQTGSTRPFANRPYGHRFFVFPLTIAAHSSQTIYLRLASNGPLTIPARLWTPEAFHFYERNDYLAQLWYFGIATAMLVLNLLLFLALRDRLYLFYVAFVSCMVATLAIQNGLMKEFLVQDAPLWSAIAPNVGYSLSLATLLLFMREMLGTAQLFPRYDRFLKVLVGLFLLTTLGFTVALPALIQPAAFLYGASAILILATGLLSMVRRQRSAAYFVAAFSMLCCAAFITVLRAIGIVPTTLFTSNALQIGSALEMLLLAFALADRFNLARRETATAQHEALQAQQVLLSNLQTSERELEQHVQQRTAEIDTKNTTLKQAMASLEAMERIARHDLKTPLTRITAAVDSLRAKRPLSESESTLLLMTESAAKRALAIVNLSLDLFKMESGQYICRPIALNFSALIQTVMGDLAQQASSKQVQLQLLGHAPALWVHAEETLCYSILANLIKNAIEAAPDGSVVLLRLTDGADGAQVVLRVQNAGMVPLAMQARFFVKYATAGKLGGTGLGNYSSRLLAQVQHGSLSMESSEQGTTLTLSLPLGTQLSTPLDTAQDHAQDHAQASVPSNPASGPDLAVFHRHLPAT